MITKAEKQAIREAIGSAVADTLFKRPSIDGGYMPTDVMRAGGTVWTMVKGTHFKITVESE